MIISGSVFDFEKIIDTKRIEVYRQDTHIYIRKGLVDYKFNVKDLLNKMEIQIVVKPNLENIDNLENGFLRS